MRVSFGFQTLVLAGLLFTGNSQAQHNTLTPGESVAGYSLLFNGTNLTGWRSWDVTTPPSSWSAIAESTWRVISNISGPTNSLITTDATYQNFDFKVEYNVPSAGNSGIFIRYNQYGINNWGGASGPESQIAAINNSDGTSPTHRMGTCYDMFPLDTRALNWDTPGGGVNYGRYQQFRVIAYENHVAHFGNGMKLLEYLIRSPAWNAAYSGSKYAPYPIYATVHPGGMYLQHHGELNVRFRDIRIKKLSTAAQNPWAVGSPYLINPNDTTSGLRDLTFSDNLFPPVPISTEPGAQAGLSMVRSREGISVLFGQRKNCVVTLQDFAGRVKYSLSVVDADKAFIPATKALGMQILRVRSEGRELMRSLIPPN